MDKRINLGSDEQRDDERRCDESRLSQQINQYECRDAENYSLKKDDEAESFKDHVSPIFGKVTRELYPIPLQLLSDSRRVC